MSLSLSCVRALVPALLALTLGSAPTVAAPSAQPGFVTTNGTHFELDGRPFYFQGTNASDLAMGSAHSESDIYYAMQQYANYGLKVVRLWGFSCKGAFYGRPMVEWVDSYQAHYNEDALAKLDATLDAARAAGIKVILPLVNFEPEYCGINWWVKSITGSDDKQQFYKDERVKSVFRRHIATMLNRVNTRYKSHSGRSIRYADDSTIMAIEVMNEPHTQDGYDHSGKLVQNFLDETSTYIRSIDDKHLISSGEEGYKTGIDSQRDGYDHDWINNGLKGVNFEANIWLKNIDFATVHTYPDNADIHSWDFAWVTKNMIQRRADLAHWANKPIVMEESGFNENSSFHGSLGYYNSTAYWLQEVYKAANNADFAGTIIWQIFPNGWHHGGYDYELNSAVGKVVSDQAYYMNHR